MGNNDNNNGMNINDLGTIRNILMGEQISEFEKKFNTLEEQVKMLEQQLKDKIDSVEATNNDARAIHEKASNMRFEELEKSLINNIAKLDKKIDKISRDDKMRLGKMLDKVSKTLMGE